MNYKIKHLLIILIFCFTIYVPFCISIFEQSKIVSSLEKRLLTKFPNIPKNIDELVETPLLIDNYFSDNFGFRQQFTSSYKKFKLWLGDSSSNDVTIGEDGWYFLGSNKKNYNKFGDPIGDYRNINRYTNLQLKKVTEYLQGQQLWLKKQGIEYMFFIAPNKHSIYSDKLPKYLSKKYKDSATDQLISYLRENTTINVIDVRDDLIAHRDKQLYYKTDTHWNHEAANIVQYRIIKEVGKLYPNKISSQYFPIKNSKNSFAGDLTRFLGINEKDDFNPKPEFNNTCEPIKTVVNKNIFTMACQNQQLTTVIYGDSYFKDFLMDYFSRKFKSTTFLWRKPNYQSLKKQINIHNPEIVIEEWIERHLPYVPKHYADFKRHL